MAESPSEAGVPNLNLNPEEKRVYGQLFRQADTDNVGVVTGEVAVKFFEKTRLDSRILGEIWQIADKDNRGFLTPAGFGIVLRLIGHAQAGREPSPEMALQQGPIPRFDGITIAPAPTATPAVPAALLPQGTGPIRIPSLTPDKVAQYAGLFERQPLQGNMLPGDQAKQIFERSGLPNEALGRIWMLADTEQRGALVSTEFVIAMHLLSCIKSGALRVLPNILPAALYEAATRRGPAAAAQRQSPTISTTIPAIPRQLSGQLTGQAGLTQMRTGSPLGLPPFTPATSAPAGPAAEWLITPAEKGRYDMLYNELDKSNKGFITGEEAVTFFGQSKLPGEILASIWDLADINSEGRLNRDEFAVAMYLIRQQRSKQDGSIPLPSSLPANLIPPSMRNLVRPVSTFEPAAPPTPALAPPRPSAVDDLFGLDDVLPPTMPAAQPQVAMGTGGSGGTDPFAGGLSPPVPSTPIRPSSTGTTFKPFVPSSTFGRGLTAQGTGGSTGSAPPPPPSLRQAPPLTVEDDLLGDSDGSSKAAGSSATVELANLSNQIGSLTKQVQHVHVQRTAAQNDLSQAAAQKTNFEQRLGQLRAMYDKEAKDVQSLQAKLAESKKATSKLQKDMAMINATYQDLQSQRQQVLGALQADQKENASLKERIASVNAEVAQLKPQLEKLRSEARQQKGLVAINKKQLATVEGERDKSKSEMDELAKINADARQGSPSSGRVASPALSTASGNNPFFKRTGSMDRGNAFSAAPPMRSFSDKSFDDVFGPSFPATGPDTGASAAPVPAAIPAPNRPQLTGNSTGSAVSFGTPTSPNPPRIDVPPPPESRQLSSTHLPFVEPPESLSSSRQVSPPMSRLQTPGTEPNAKPPFGPAWLASGVNNAKQAAALPEESQSTTTVPSNFFDYKSKDETATSVTTDTFHAANDAKAREEFDAAFASFKTAKISDKTTASANPAKSLSNFDSEFPPISELERDESDSEDDRDGFDDDFAPVSPPPAKLAAQPAKPPHVSPPKTVEPETTIPPQLSSENQTTAMGGVNDVTGTHADNLFGSGTVPPTTMAPASSASSSQPPPPPVPAKAAFDDLDDDFEGLEDAKEGSADDDFANISRSGLDDYNGAFDSSPSHAQLRSEAPNAHSTAPFGTDGSFDFASLSTASAAGSATAVAPPATTSAGSATTAKAPDSHDWDAIFSSLDDAPATTAVTGDNTALKEPTRPSTPGRALTEGGEHDDPILKNLTGMGYSRTDALSALEKYDYNLERAANYLANQS